MSRLIPPLLCILFSASVGSAAAQTPDNGGPSLNEAFATTESMLLNARTLELAFRARSTGAFEADISGVLSREGPADVELTATGTFGGEAVDLHLSTASGALVGGNGNNTFTRPVPRELNESLIFGLMRMGILHNLAMLTAGQPPDHAEGGVGDWVQATDLRGIPERGDADAQALRFTVQVGGEPTAEATLWLQRALPLRRTQSVAFPGGVMQVTEEYEFLELVPGPAAVRLLK